MRKDIHHAAPMPQVMATLYFGANIPGMTGHGLGADDFVTDDNFKRFIADSVTPRFPGFTLATVEGYWKGEPETVRVLTVLGEDDTSFRTNVRIMAEHYKSDFGQEAVAYSFTPCEFTLNCWPFGPVGAYHKPGLGY